MTVDPTFNLEESECTPTTYCHLVVQTRRYKTYSIFLGPILTHYWKIFPTFLHFSSALVALRKDLEVFGSDGKKALILCICARV